MASNLKELVKELNGMGELLEAQVLAGLERDEVLDALYRSMLDRINTQAKLSADASLQISSALHSSPFTSEQIKQLARAVLSSGSSKQQKKKASRANQKCWHLENFVDEAKWVKLRDSKISDNTRLSLLSQVCACIGLVNPDQKTLYRGVAIAVYAAGHEDISQQEVLKLMDKLQAFIKQHPENSELEYITEFPLTADELPSRHKSALGDPLPVEVDIPDLSTILGDNKMRGRVRKNKDPEWLASVPECQRDIVRRALAGQGQMQLARAASSSHIPQPSPEKRACDADHSVVPASATHGLPEILRFTQHNTVKAKASQDDRVSLEKMEEDMLARMRETKNKKTKLQKKKLKKGKSKVEEEEAEEEEDEAEEEGEENAAEDKDTGDQDDDDDDNDDDDDDDEDGDAEDDKGTAAKKKPSAAMKVLKTPMDALKKKPASKKDVPKTIKKRPACARPNMKMIFKELKRIGPTISRKRFTSRAYHAVQKLKQREGCADDVAKDHARKASHKASKLYDDLSV